MSNNKKFVPVPMSALMANLFPLQTEYSPDCSFTSNDSDNSIAEINKDDREADKAEVAYSTPKSEIKQSNKAENKIISFDYAKENVNNNNSLSSLTYPCRGNGGSASKSVLSGVYPSSEIKKRQVLEPCENYLRSQVPIVRKIPKQQLLSSNERNTGFKKSTPDVLKFRDRPTSTHKKTPEIAIVQSNQKAKVSTPVIKSGIRRFTPGSARKSQKIIQQNLDIVQNKDSVRCLFPGNQKKEEQVVVPETPINKNSLMAPCVATPSYPQGVVGLRSKVHLKSTSINGKNYMFLRKLGIGGSSEVFKVFEVGTGCEYAVKCVNLSTDKELAQGYVNEVRLLRKLQNSDRVIRLFDYEYDRSSKVLRVVLEVGETDLSSFLKARGAGLPPALVVHYWEEMLRAVQYIHEHDVIHADLKPANFLLVSGQLKLIDFGIASTISSDATSVVRSQATGTYSYISPEALGGAASDRGREGHAMKISFRSDVWSLGCILYSMVYGRTPFSHIPNLAKLAAIMDPNHRIDYPPVERLPPALIVALRHCLRYWVRERPSVQQLLAIPYLQGASSPIYDCTALHDNGTQIHSQNAPSHSK